MDDKTQSDLLGEANKILEELNKMADDPDRYANEHKVNLNKPNKGKDGEERE